jgi:hypothetical protein
MDMATACRTRALKQVRGITMRCNRVASQPKENYMKKYLIAAAFVLVAPTILPSHLVPRENRAQAAPGKVRLRLRLKPEHHYVMRIATDNTTFMNGMGMGQNRPMRQNMTMKFDTRVLAVAPNGTMTTQMKITGMKMVMNM